MATLSEVMMQAVAHHQAGRLQAAEGIYRQVLGVDPNQPEALHLLGLIAVQAGRHGDAVDLIERAIRLHPTMPVFHSNLGEVYRALQKFPEAIACHERALALDPGFALAHNNMGLALRDLVRLDEAAQCFREALRLDEGFAEAHNNLGNVLGNMGRHDEAIACYQRALALKPNAAGPYLNWGNALADQGMFAEAIACYQKVIELDPDLADAHNNLGYALQCQGKLADALACYRRAVESKPSAAWLHSSMLYTLNYSPDYDGPALLEEHRRWNERHAQPLAKFVQPHANDPAPQRRLRIGYVSPDFSFQPLGWFMAPLLEAHDRRNVEIVCYSSVRQQDQITQKCRAHSDLWRHVHDLSDEQLAQLVRDDRIDVLVDLTMHAADNRLLMFARKPAPVQVTYLAYCGTTGMDAMDYRLTDPYLDPQSIGPMGLAEACYSEVSIWLPQTYWCYRPPMETPPVNRLPALDTGHVTFGCLNTFHKITDSTLAAWSRLLQKLPSARLLLHCPAAVHSSLRGFFGRHNVAPERLRFVERVPLGDYYRIYGSVDVALDPFPYGGGTTTCDALWMGIPVVTLAGKTAVGRGGLSILSNLGMPELVANDTDEYINIAADLAGDPERLRDLRAGLRPRMQASPLMDAPRFAHAMEAAFREMWRRWCHKRSP